MKPLRSLAIAGALAVLSGFLCFARAATNYGTLTGVVIDPGRTPQMGATVLLTPEADGASSVQLLTDQNGMFLGQRLHPGQYSVKVTLVGFLPVIEHNVRVTANITTVLRIELDSVFSSLDQLRRPSAQQTESDDWKWVLRTSAATRPILQFANGSVQVANVWPAGDAPAAPRTDIRMSNGAIEPGASSARGGAMATAASYDKSLGRNGKLLIAGQVSYDQSDAPYNTLGGAVASVWVPSGALGKGSETTLVIRQMGLPVGGRPNRMGRLEHSEQIRVGDRVAIRYGAEYLMGTLGPNMTGSLRPHATAEVELGSGWKAKFALATDPDLYGFGAGHSTDSDVAMEALNALPVMFQGNGQTFLEGGWHEEASLEKAVSARGRLEGAVFHDYSAHQAVFEAGTNYGYTGVFFGDQLLASDGGAGGAWGARVVYHEKISRNIEVAGIYARAGVLAPDGLGPVPTGLPGMLRMSYRNSAAARISGTVPRLGTQFSASYKWIDGVAATRQDLYGEEALGIDPNLSVTVRQPLPCLRVGCHWELLANMRNILGQGYVPLGEGENRVLVEPVERSFRGGLSFQF